MFRVGAWLLLLLGCVGKSQSDVCWEVWLSCFLLISSLMVAFGGKVWVFEFFSKKLRKKIFRAQK